MLAVVLVTPLRLTLCNPMNYSPPSSSVPGILQARILEWVAVPSSRVSSPPKDQASISCLLLWQEDSLPLAAPGGVAVKKKLPMTRQCR